MIPSAIALVTAAAALLAQGWRDPGPHGIWGLLLGMLAGVCLVGALAAFVFAKFV